MLGIIFSIIVINGKDHYIKFCITTFHGLKDYHQYYENHDYINNVVYMCQLALHVCCVYVNLVYNYYFCRIHFWIFNI